MIGWQLAYAHARKLEERGNWEAAAATYERLVQRGEAANPRVVFRLGHALFRLDRLDEALPHLDSAVELDPGQAGWHYRRAFVLERRKRFAEALAGYRTALELAPGQGWERRAAACRAGIAQERLEEVLRTKPPTWQLIEVLEEGLGARADDPRWLERLGDARFRMSRYPGAADAYADAGRLTPDASGLHFKEGWARELAGEPDAARRCYEQALRHEKAEELRAYGVGAWFQARGQWRLAAEHYAESLRRAGGSGELWYRLGLARQKIYDWAGAADALEAGLRVDPGAEKLYWRLGLSWERLGDAGKAEAAYARILGSAGPEHGYWKYRLGYVLAAQGRYRQACLAFGLSRPGWPLQLEEDPALPAAARAEPYFQQVLERELDRALAAQSAEACQRVGRQAEAAGCLALAAGAYQAAAERAADYQPELWFRLGCALMNSGRYREACTAFLETRQFKRPHGVDATAFLKQHHHRRQMPYTEYLETLPIQAGTVLYESSHGAAAAGNPLHLCRAILADPRFAGFRHVWVLNDRTRIPAEFAGRPDFIFVPRDSDLYLRYLATARYLVNDNTFPPYFLRREEQQYLNTWHGTPLKTLGRDIRGGLLEHRNAARNFLHATHLIAPNRFTADCLIERYDVAGLFPGRLALTGYPRIDAVVAADDEAAARLRRRLNIPVGGKVVLYAPTWRGSLEHRTVDRERLQADVAALASGDWHLLYRGHAMTDPSAAEADTWTVPPDIDTNDLLAIVDVLITDYSSIFFDFIPTGRPILHYAYDLESYREERGLYFELESMPGTLCRNLPELMLRTAEALADPAAATDTPEYRAGREKFCPLEDGRAAARVVEFFFFADSGHELPTGRNGKRNVLMFQGSFLPNGITTSYLNLASAIDSTENNVVLVVDPAALASRPERLENFGRNPEHVRVLARVGSHVLTPEERWVIDKFNARHTVDSEEMWQIIDRAFAREFRRVFGWADFDAIVCFEGYARFWTALLGSAPLKRARKSVYLHNDMVREWHNRFEYLEANFRLYRKYDRLISVTESVAEENRRRLAPRFGLDPDAFTYANNLINEQQTLLLAGEELDKDIAAFAGPAGDSGPFFVTAGRLSPEKGHLKLIRAFAAVTADRPDAKLAILGEGPLHGQLQEAIGQLGLDGRVLLAGRRDNPFPAVKRADCFVFSSDYEGQGLAVLEALILGRPVVSTDVVGPRSVLKDGCGLLVEDSSEGLAGGMRAFLAGAVPAGPFEPEIYRKDALARFAAEAL